MASGMMNFMVVLCVSSKGTKRKKPGIDTNDPLVTRSKTNEQKNYKLRFDFVRIQIDNSS